MKILKIRFRGLQASIAGAAAGLVVLAAPCRAQSARAPAAPASTAFGSYVLDSIGDYFANWFIRSERAREEQPHWITPLVTTTPRLEQEIRFDQNWQGLPHGVGQNNSTGRIELIPTEDTELILGIPPYIAKSKYKKPPATHGMDGWGDVSFLFKYRLLAANEEKGNCIVTAFLGITTPTASKRLGAGHAVYAPTIAFGKGWGDFDFQSTLGVAFPNGGEDRLGMPLTFNTALQYRVLKKIWPELEFNYTWWPNGERTGQNSLIITPGVIFGRLPIWRTLGFTIGGGYQFAVTRHRLFDNAWLLSARLPF